MEPCIEVKRGCRKDRIKKGQMAGEEMKELNAAEQFYALAS